MSSKRILIADDHLAIRNGVKAILNCEFESLQIDQASNGEEALLKLRQFNWDLLILDIDLPEKNGYDVLKIMHAEEMNVPVLVFSFHSHPSVEGRVMDLGARAFLAKDSPLSRVIELVQRILTER